MWVVAVLRAPLGRRAAREDSGSASTASMRCVCAAAMLLLMAACAVDARMRCTRRWAAASQLRRCTRATAIQEAGRGLNRASEVSTHVAVRCGYMDLFFSMPRLTARSGIQGSQGQQKAGRIAFQTGATRIGSASVKCAHLRPHIGSQRAASELASRSLNTAEFHNKWPPRRRPRSRNRVWWTL